MDNGTAGSSYTYSINWGDGSSATYGTSDTPSHIYVDDNPTSTPSDNYTITVTAGWVTGLQATGSGTVTVTNVGPTAKNDPSADPILASLAGSFQTDEDTPFLTGDVLINDDDQSPQDVLHIVSIDTTGTKGSVSQVGAGKFQYDPGDAWDTLGVGQTAADFFNYTIVDDDDPTKTSTGTVKITVTGKQEIYQLAASIEEVAKEDGAVVAKLHLTLSPPAKSGGVTIEWQPWTDPNGGPTGDDVAEPSDLENSSGSITFNEGEFEKTIDLIPVDDTIVELNETFYLEV